ncbi:glycosyltransferase, partial [Candidatus Roizmanbacteria bacterium]|nr:glycosyltransferase [Candidatus Roizmanbacteria bacterium]
NNCTDNTVPIAKKYPVRIIREEKQGIIFARNAGFENAKANILARCDADVIVPKDWVKKISDNFAKKNINALTGPAYFYDFFLAKQTILPFFLYHYILRIILGHHVLAGPNLALTKNVWEKIKNEVCDDDTLVHEDIDLSLHIHKYGEIQLDPSFVVKVSGRRVYNNPMSFFIEYPLRLIKTIKTHKV